MLASLVIVPVVSLITKKPEKKFVDDIKATRPTLTEAEKTYADNTGHIYGDVMTELHVKLGQFGTPMYNAYVS